MRSLECIDLTDNRLRCLPAAIALPRLVTLSLARNELVTLPKELSRTAPHLKRLGLAKNPLQVQRGTPAVILRPPADTEPSLTRSRRWKSLPKGFTRS